MTQEEVALYLHISMAVMQSQAEFWKYADIHIMCVFAFFFYNSSINA